VSKWDLDIGQIAMAFLLTPKKTGFQVLRKMPWHYPVLLGCRFDTDRFMVKYGTVR
jgi:hypothetical protein